LHSFSGCNYQLTVSTVVQYCSRDCYEIGPELSWSGARWLKEVYDRSDKNALWPTNECSTRAFETNEEFVLEAVIRSKEKEQFGKKKGEEKCRSSGGDMARECVYCTSTATRSTPVVVVVLLHTVQADPKDITVNIDHQ
jgi:hypothetical protein